MKYTGSGSALYLRVFRKKLSGDSSFRLSAAPGKLDGRKVYSEKTQGTKITIQEDLTAAEMKTLKAAVRL
ncbi:hypothetical protein J6590_007624 [Homalodisca vitripennis]|nr:hypothetical protein J6590_007624 [Homalodisca vitripennis]